MAIFIAKNLIDGKLTWAKVVKSPTYMKYADRALDILRSKGYYIDKEGNCVKIGLTN